MSTLSDPMFHSSLPVGIGARFERLYYPEPNSGCWLWLGACLYDRYGQLSYGVIGWQGTKTRLAHRVGYCLFKGDIPPDGVLLHRCDNRLCVNPDHLRVGTYRENNQEIVKKGRHSPEKKRAANLAMHADPERKALYLKRWRASNGF